MAGGLDHRCDLHEAAMTEDTATRPDTVRRTQARRQKLPRLSLAAGMGALAKAVGHAFELAYVAPYSGSRRPRPAPPQAEDGRDPAW